MPTPGNGKDTEKIISLLARMPLLGQFSREQLGQILSFTSIHVYELGDSIIQEGDTDRSLFLLISGKAAVIKQGRPIGRIETLGDIFGEMSLVDGSARSASIVAAERTICLRIKASFLESAGDSAQSMLSQNIVFRALAGVLAGRVRQINAELLTLRQELESAKAARSGKGR